MKTELGKKAADIFLAQETMLLDPSVVEELKTTMEAERINAEQAVRMVIPPFLFVESLQVGPMLCPVC